VPSKDAATAARTGRCQTSLCGEGMGEGTVRGRGWWSEVTAARTMGWLTGGASLSAGAVASEGEGEATNEWGRRVSGARARARSGPEVGRGGGGGVASAEGGKRPRAWAGIGPARGRERLLLFFLFSNFYFHFYILFF
jgi:hypothetical protein